MSTGKRKDARFDLRLNSDLMSRFEAAIGACPEIKNRTQAMEEAIELWIQKHSGRLSEVKPEWLALLDDFRAEVRPIPDQEDAMGMAIRIAIEAVRNKP